MKTFIDTPDDIHPADKIGWVQGYNQCLTDHEYMDTHAHLQAKVSVAAGRIDELEKQLADAISRIPARHAETKVKQADQIAPTNLAFWGIVENEEVECS